MLRVFSAVLRRRVMSLCVYNVKSVFRACVIYLKNPDRNIVLSLIKPYDHEDIYILGVLYIVCDESKFENHHFV